MARFNLHINKRKQPVRRTYRSLMRDVMWHESGDSIELRVSRDPVEMAIMDVAAAKLAYDLVVK